MPPHELIIITSQGRGAKVPAGAVQAACKQALSLIRRRVLRPLGMGWSTDGTLKNFVRANGSLHHHGPGGLEPYNIIIEAKGAERKEEAFGRERIAFRTFFPLLPAPHSLSSRASGSRPLAGGASQRKRESGNECEH